MKTKLLYTSLFLILIVFGCGKDNYNHPKSVFSGKILASESGERIGVKGTGNSIQLELWQSGYDLYTSIPVFVSQDGSFKTVLYDGDYKLVPKNGNGPWVSKQDTVELTVKGNTYVDYMVDPFYTISDESFSLDNNRLTATFRVTQVTGMQPLERAILVVNKTAFVDETYSPQ